MDFHKKHKLNIQVFYKKIFVKNSKKRFSKKEKSQNFFLVMLKSFCVLSPIFVISFFTKNPIIITILFK